MAKYPEESDWYAYKGAFYGYKIGLNPVKAPFLGQKSMDNIDLAIEIRSGAVRKGGLKRGMRFFTCQKPLGGLRTKALEAYKKAIRLMENKPETLHHNWIISECIDDSGSELRKDRRF